MAYGTKAAFEPIREVAFGDVGAAYTAVGTGITDRARIIRIVNSLDNEVYISLDGVVDNVRMSSNSFFIIDLASNKVRNDGMFFRVGTIFFIREVSVSPTSGSLWIEVLFAAGGN